VVEIQTLHHICLTILNRFRTVMARTLAMTYTQYNKVCIFANAENRKYKTREHTPLLQNRMFLV
jgi:hypothetical protein